MEHPTLDREDASSAAVHAMNNTAGQNRRVPTLLLFGVVPRFPSGSRDILEQRDRMRAIKSARDEIVKAVAASRLRTTMSRNVPGAADNEVKVGMEVLVYRERPENKWAVLLKSLQGTKRLFV